MQKSLTASRLWRKTKMTQKRQMITEPWLDKKRKDNQCSVEFHFLTSCLTVKPSSWPSMCLYWLIEGFVDFRID